MVDHEEPAAVGPQSRDFRIPALARVLRIVAGPPHLASAMKHGEIPHAVHAQRLQFDRRMCGEHMLIPGANSVPVHGWCSRSNRDRFWFVQRDHRIQVMAIERRAEVQVELS